MRKPRIYSGNAHGRSTTVMNDTAVAGSRCLNCDSEVSAGGRFCAVCGQKAIAPRLSLHHIAHELVHALAHVDRSAVSLVRYLLLRPGFVARDYVEGRRQRYYGPFAFLVVVVALASALVAITGFRVVTSSVPNAAADFIQHHVNLVFFAQVPLLAALCRVLGGRGARYNYAEYLVLASYTSAMHILFYAMIVVPVWYVLRPAPDMAARLTYLYVPIWPAYFGYAACQFLPGRRLWDALRGIVAVVATQAITIGVISGLINLYLLITTPN